MARRAGQVEDGHDVSGALDALTILPLDRPPAERHERRAARTDSDRQNLVAPAVAGNDERRCKSQSHADHLTANGGGKSKPDRDDENGSIIPRKRPLPIPANRCQKVGDTGLELVPPSLSRLLETAKSQLFQAL